MAFTIKIYEKDEHLFSLLKRRLSSFFPDAYIIDPYLDDTDRENRFSTFTRVLYDPKDIKAEDISQISTSPLRLTEDSGIIDCSRLIRLLCSDEGTQIVRMPLSGSMYAVLPFVYADQRDRFICDLSTDLSGAGQNIRLDFTSKFRALWRAASGSNMTALLEACRSKKFKPEDILKYCNLDDAGFLTPGCTKDYDDVFDLGLERSITLMHHAASLAHSKTSHINVLSVIEGFKTRDLPELLSCCDKVILLFPPEHIADEMGANDLIELLSKSLGKERISVYYANESGNPDVSCDNIQHRRMVV